jgi:hypothetical protein
VAFVPGTVIEVWAMRGKVRGAPRRGIVGDESPQEVLVR